MAPKKQTKADVKKKEKNVEDKTFGLKNKNRSKAVQKYCSTVSNNMMNNKQKELESEKKRQAKLEKQAKEQEMKKMYGGLEADEKLQKKKKAEEEAAQLAAAERGEYLWTADDFDEIEGDESRLEELLEEERQTLVGRSDLTPVNEESFQKWWNSTRGEEAKAIEKMKKSALKKFKQTGRGISGRELFDHDATLFKDDEDAAAVIDREEEDEAKVDDEGLFDGEEDLPDDEE